MKGNSMFFAIVFIFTTALSAQVKERNYDWNTILKNEGKIKLTETKIWGGINAPKEELFKYPGDIAVDSKGNYFIADPALNEITVFDKNGKYLKKIGREGSGPGDLKYPSSIGFDSKDNLYVAEEANKRIQVFSGSKSSFIISPPETYFYELKVDKKGRMALYNNSLKNGAPFINIYDKSKEPICKIGSFYNPKNGTGISNSYAKGRSFTIDYEGNLYLGNIYGKPAIEKYSSDGKLLMKINWQFGTSPKDIKINNGTVSGGNQPGIRGVETDDKGNIFVLVQKKAFLEEENKYLGSTMMVGGKSAGVTITNIPPKARKDKFDNYAIIVFDKNGNLTGFKSLEFYVTKMKVAGGYIFLIDGNTDYVIHQYKYSK